MSVIEKALSAATEGGGYVPPSPADFNLPPVGADRTFSFLGETMYLGVTKPMVQLVLSSVLIFVFFYVVSRRTSLVPGRLQYIGEQGYGFVRNSLGRDILGDRDFARYVPYLFALFFFVLINNWFGSVPGLQ
ncbi:MAG: F0F1 ATP synthase subunit A, partial [Nocardioides sp.]